MPKIYPATISDIELFALQAAFLDSDIKLTDIVVQWKWTGWSARCRFDELHIEHDGNEVKGQEQLLLNLIWNMDI